MSKAEGLLGAFWETLIPGKGIEEGTSSAEDEAQKFLTGVVELSVLTLMGVLCKAKVMEPLDLGWGDLGRFR